MEIEEREAILNKVFEEKEVVSCELQSCKKLIERQDAVFEFGCILHDKCATRIFFYGPNA